MLKITTKFFEIEGSDGKEVIKALEAFIETPAMKKVQEAYSCFIEDMYDKGEPVDTDIDAPSRYEAMECVGPECPDAPKYQDRGLTEAPPIIIDFDNTHKYTYQCEKCHRPVIKRERTDTETIDCTCGQSKDIDNDNFQMVDVPCVKCGYMHKGMFVENNSEFVIRCVECRKEINIQVYLI